jgi:putative ABC transport system substrate-binding protein
MNSIKKIVALSLVCNIALLAYVAFSRKCPQAGSKSAAPVVQHAAGQNVGPKKSVAIVLPATHPSLNQIQQGFTDALTKSGLNCEFAIYNSNGNRMLMRSQIEEVIQKNHDLVFTIGSSASHMACEVMQKKQATIPIVFSAVEQGFAANHFLESAKNQRAYVTGLFSDNNFKQQVDVLMALKPSTKSVVLVYDPTTKGGIDQDVKEMRELFAKHSVRLNLVEVFKPNQVYEKSQALIPGNDVVLVLKDHTVVQAIDSLIKICNRVAIPLYVSELDSPLKGAALGFGVGSYSTGEQAAQKALPILRDGVHPGDVKPTDEVDCKIALNVQAMKKQGLQLDENMLFLMRSSMIIGDNGEVVS